MQAHILSIHTPQPLGSGQKAKTFSSKSIHVTYQIKWNGTSRNMQAHVLFSHTPSEPGVDRKVKTFFFLKVILLSLSTKKIKKLQLTVQKGAGCCVSFVTSSAASRDSAVVLTTGSYQFWVAH